MHFLLKQMPKALEVLAEVESLLAQHGIAATNETLDLASDVAGIEHVAIRGSYRLSWRVNLLKDPFDSAETVNVEVALRKLMAEGDDEDVWVLLFFPNHASSEAWEKIIAPTDIPLGIGRIIHGLLIGSCDSTEAFEVITRIAETFNAIPVSAPPSSD
jgi:hypothetical protein